MHGRVLVLMVRRAEFQDEKTKENVRTAELTFCDLEPVGRPGGKNYGLPSRRVWVGAKVRDVLDELDDAFVPGVYDADFYESFDGKVKISDLRPVGRMDFGPVLSQTGDSVVVSAPANGRK